MSDQVNLKLSNIGPINNADIELSKINVIGGQNSTGKSTSSKLLYCFLTSFSTEVLDSATESISSACLMFIEELEIHAISKQGLYVHLSKLKKHFKNVDDLDSLIYYAKNLKEFFNLAFSNLNIKSLNQKMDKISEAIELVNDSYINFYKSFLVDALESELDITKNNTKDGRIEFNAKLNEESVRSSVDLKRFTIDLDGRFEVSDVHYIDSFSIFDWDDKGLFHTPHVKKLLNDLKDFSERNDVLEEVKHEKIIAIEDKIKKLIGGTVRYEGNDIVYEPLTEDNFSMKNTASGIKQVGIIQLLLANRKLKESDYLIMDEPEVNLHPEWQLKLAEILVLLAKDLDVTVYINSHSPMFIEAIDTFAEYYDMDRYTNFYLTEEAENNLHNVNRIDPYELYIIYDNLGDPYDTLDRVRLSKGRK